MQKCMTKKEHKQNTLQWLCEQKGVKWHTFVTRFYYLGWDIERALNEVPRKRDKEAHKRWEKVWELHKNGESRNNIAEKFNLDPTYVTRIICKMRKKELTISKDNMIRLF